MEGEEIRSALSEMAGRDEELLRLQAECERLRAERDRLAVELWHDDLVGRAAPESERPDWSSVGIVLTALSRGSLPGGRLAAALAEHDQRMRGV